MKAGQRIEEGRKSLRFMLFAFLLLSGSFIVYFVYFVMGDIGFNPLSRVVAVVCVALVMIAGGFVLRRLSQRERKRSNPFARGNIERQSLVGGAVSFLLGLAAMCVGCALLFEEGDRWSAWIASFVVMFLGLLFASAGGIGMLIVPILRRWQRRRILNLGIPVAAQVTEIRNKDDESPYWIMQAEVADKRLGAEGIFISHAFGNDPRTNRWWQNLKKDYPIGSEIIVRYLPEDPRTYAFDLADRLVGPRPRIRPMPVSVREAWIRGNIGEICTNALADGSDVTWTIKRMSHQGRFTWVETEAPLAAELGCALFRVVLRCEGETDPEVEGAYGWTSTRWTLLFGDPTEWEADRSELDSGKER